jgi:hydrogenase maturation protease
VGRDLLIILDALASGGEPGDIVTFDRQQLCVYLPNVRLSAHQPCLQETLFRAETAGACPAEVLLVGVVGDSFEVGTEPGARVAAAMPAALETIVDLVRRHGVEIRKRREPRAVDSWWSVQKAFAT